MARAIRGQVLVGLPPYPPESLSRKGSGFSTLGLSFLTCRMGMGTDPTPQSKGRAKLVNPGKASSMHWGTEEALLWGPGRKDLSSACVHDFDFIYLFILTLT